jgi:cytoskeletal protein CcmA (bactofilin family)
MFKRETPAQNTPQQPPPAQNTQQQAQPQRPAAPKMETVIGPNCQMSGIIKSDGGIRIEGVFDGQIMTAGNLYIAETAKVIAEIQAFNIVVSGSMKGNITANKLEITETGKVWGDLNINSITLAEGAYLRGNTNMTGDLEPPMIEAPKFVAAKVVVPELSAPRN